MRKLTMLINSLSGISCGWSETMYTSSSSDAAVRTLAQDWMDARSQMLSKDYQVVACRISSDINAPPVLSYMLVPPAEIVGKDTGASDYPNTAVLISMRESSHSESRSLRGWADDRVEKLSGSVKLALTPSGMSKLATYGTFLTSRNIGWARSKQQGDVGFLSSKITGITILAQTGNVQLAGAFPEGMLAPNEGVVVVKGFKGPRRPVNGSYRPGAYSIDSVALALETKLPAGTTADYISGTAIAYQQSLVFSSVTSVTYVRITAHKTGRPFGSLVGRR